MDQGGGDSASQEGNNVYQNADGRYRARNMLPGDGAEWTDDDTQDMYVLFLPPSFHCLVWLWLYF